MMEKRPPEPSSDTVEAVESPSGWVMHGEAERKRRAAAGPGGSAKKRRRRGG